MIDFEVHLGQGPVCFLIHPDQVHGWLDPGPRDGWMMAFDPGLVTPESLSLIAPLSYLAIADHQAQTFALLHRLVEVLWQTFQLEGKGLDQPLTLRYLLNALLTLLARLDQAPQPASNRPIARGDELTAAFQRLLKANFRDWKRPAQYAQRMHLSVNHLNEVVKAKTGYSVSYWIHYQTMLEARRQLYHTQQTVKEVAYQLGFDDPHYFSRLFRNVTGQTPVTFRRSFRDLCPKSEL